MTDLTSWKAKLARIKGASQSLRSLPTSTKNGVLEALRQWLDSHSAQILEANAMDLARLDANQSPAFRDRLTLTKKRIDGMRSGLSQIIEAPDPVGDVIEAKTLANGLQTTRVRSPLGVLYMIFEARPNVAIESFALAFKAGNAILLRGGKESLETVSVLYSGIIEALKSQSVNTDSFCGITDPSRELTAHLLKQKKMIDVVVPRGGDQLISFVDETSEIPVIKNDRGLCHVYVHHDANLGMAADIIVNAKVQRPGVCNALETLLVHRSVVRVFLPKLFDLMEAHSVTWFACPESIEALGAARALLQQATPESFDTEYLDLKMSVKVVGGVEEALAHIERHGSRHSEVIVTENAEVAERFLEGVDCAAAYWNASTRFTDGEQLGLGGELGISTQKLHVRGPVGLKELTSVRWVIRGKGQVRGD